VHLRIEIGSTPTVVAAWIRETILLSPSKVSMGTTPMGTRRSSLSETRRLVADGPRSSAGMTRPGRSFGPTSDCSRTPPCARIEPCVSEVSTCHCSMCWPISRRFNTTCEFHRSLQNGVELVSQRKTASTQGKPSRDPCRHRRANRWPPWWHAPSFQHRLPSNEQAATAPRAPRIREPARLSRLVEYALDPQ